MAREPERTGRRDDDRALRAGRAYRRRARRDGAVADRPVRGMLHRDAGNRTRRLPRAAAGRVRARHSVHGDRDRPLRRARRADRIERAGRPLRDLPADRDAARTLSAADRRAGRGRRHQCREGPLRAHHAAMSRARKPCRCSPTRWRCSIGAAAKTGSSALPNTRRWAMRRAASTRSRTRSGSPPKRRSRG